MFSVGILQVMCRKKSHHSSYFLRLIEYHSYRRHRDHKPTTTPYQIKVETIKIDNGHLTADVLNTQNAHLFKLDLFLLKDNRFRFRFNEKSPIKPRYEVENIVIDNLEQEA